MKTIESLTTLQFTYIKKELTFVAEASTLFGKLTDEPMPLYIYLKSAVTDQTLIFQRKTTDQDDEGDITAWNYLSGETVNGARINLKIIND